MECSVKDCQKPAGTHKLCHAHYEAKRVKTASVCSVDGCDRFVKTEKSGLCNMHYRRKLIENPDRAICSIDGCKDRVHANDLCTKHHIRLRRHGSFSKHKPKTFHGTEKQYEEFYRMQSSQALMRKYGITLATYEIMFEQQNGLCNICGEPNKSTSKKTGEIKRMAVDHNHDTGKVRALLCHHCNTALGNFKDSKDILLKAIEYLDKFD